MAKRSVRKVRQQGTPSPVERSGAPGPAPGPGGSRKPFWLGALVAAAVLIPIAIVAVILAASGDDPSPPAGPQNEQAKQAQQIETEAEKLQRINDTRDKEQVQELTDVMRKLSAELDPVVDGIDKTLPPGEEDEVGPLAGAADVAAWKRTTEQAAASFEETVSGETGTNVARGAIASAVRGIARTVATYELALEHRELRPELLEQARLQRDDALRAWETAGVQMDVINIAVGFGHQHPPTPGARSLPPDELPEGTDATGGG